MQSLMTPEDSPISEEAISAFASYVTSEGHKTSTVRFSHHVKNGRALTLFTPALVVQNWFTQLELYGGPNSAINAVPLDATAFAHRSSLFTIQFYASSSNFQPPYPEEGFSFLDGEPCASIGVFAARLIQRSCRHGLEHHKQQPVRLELRVSFTV